MKTDYVKKGLAIGIVVLFVCVGFSSAVAIKEVNVNNNDIINSSNVEYIEDLPDLKVVYIDIGYQFYTYDECYTVVGIKNIGDAAIDVYVRIKIFLYGGFGPLSDLIDVYEYYFRIDIASGDLEGFVFYEYRSPPDNTFLKVVVYVNYDKGVKESNYRNNVAEQKFYKPIYFWWLTRWIRIGYIRYPLFVPHQLGI